MWSAQDAFKLMHCVISLIPIPSGRWIIRLQSLSAIGVQRREHRILPGLQGLSKYEVPKQTPDQSAENL